MICPGLPASGGALLGLGFPALLYFESFAPWGGSSHFLSLAWQSILWLSLLSLLMDNFLLCLCVWDVCRVSYQLRPSREHLRLVLVVILSAA